MSGNSNQKHDLRRGKALCESCFLVIFEMNELGKRWVVSRGMVGL